MPKAKSITPKELEEIRESARQAYSRLILDTGEWGRRKKLLKKGECQTPELQMAVKLLFSLEFDPIRNLSKFPIPKVVTEALARNDHSFFIRLGKTLAAKPLGLKQMRRIEPPRLAVFLVRHWAEKRDNLPELYCLTQSSLLEVCKVALKNNRLTWDALVKWRQRLGLKAFSRLKVRAIKTPNGFRHSDEQP